MSRCAAFLSSFVKGVGALCLLDVAFHVPQPAFRILRSACYVLGSVFCISQPASWVLRSASSVLRSTTCVMGIAFHMLRRASCMACHDVVRADPQGGHHHSVRRRRVCSFARTGLSACHEIPRQALMPRQIRLPGASLPARAFVILREAQLQLPELIDTRVITRLLQAAQFHPAAGFG